MIKRLTEKFLIVFIIGLLLIIGSSCKEEKTATIKVNFESNGGSLVASRTYEKDAVVETEVPFMEGYMFLGWFLDNNVWTLSFNAKFSLEEVEDEEITVYANWELITYTISFNMGDLPAINNINLKYKQSIPTLPIPAKMGSIFLGWHTNSSLNNPFTLTTMPSSNISLYPSWDLEVVDPDPEKIKTEILGFYKLNYGNTNGNLNNLGLAVYDSNKDVHYYSSGDKLYEFNPATNETTILYNLGSKAKYLNINNNVLYFVESQNNYLCSLDLNTKLFKSIYEKEVVYVSSTQNWVNFLEKTLETGNMQYDFRRYIPKSDSISSSHSYGIEMINIYNTRVYYKYSTSFVIGLMNYDAQGKSTIITLDTKLYDDVLEHLVYKVDNEYKSYHAFIINSGLETGLYLYKSGGEILRIMTGDLRNLNYDGQYLYVVKSGVLYKIDLTNNEPTVFLQLGNSYTNVNIINRWIYIGSTESNILYRVDPTNLEIFALQS